MLYLVFVFASFEYSIVAQSIYSKSENILLYVLILGCITVILWCAKLVFTLRYLVRVHKVEGKKIEKVLKQYSGKMYIITIFVLTLCGIIIAPIRHMGADEGIVLFESPQFVFAVHGIFSLFYAKVIDIILFSIVFREEISAELQKQRDLEEWKKENRRRLKRKKTDIEET